MKIYAVGGSVRDNLLGYPSKDMDYVVVGATPYEMEIQGYQRVGKDFPVYLHPKTNEEYALARTERKIGRGYKGFETISNPSVTLHDDLFRRDLTINAMAKDLDTGEIIDPFNGQIDLKNKILRHVSQHFAEDPLRVLRVARFAARYNFQIAPETILLMERLVDEQEMKHLTFERIWIETEKALTEQYPELYFQTLYKVDAIKDLFPCLGSKHYEINKGSIAAKDINLSLREKFGALTFLLDPQTCNEFYNSEKIPSDIKSVALRANKIAQVIERKDFTTEEIMSIIIEQRLISDKDFLQVLINVCTAHGVSNTKLIRILNRVIDSVINIRFDSLTKDQQVSLRGKEISDAIYKLRVNAVNDLIYVS